MREVAIRRELEPMVLSQSELVGESRREIGRRAIAEAHGRTARVVHVMRVARLWALGIVRPLPFAGEDGLIAPGQGSSVAAHRLENRERRAVTEEKFIDLEVSGGAFARGNQYFDLGERFDALAEDAMDHRRIDVTIQRFGQQLGIVLFEGAGFLFLEAGAVTAIAADGA